MPDYKKMYIALFQSQTKAITMLQDVQQLTEEMYVSTQEPKLSLLSDIKTSANEIDEQ